VADKSLPSSQSRVKIVQIEKRKEEMNMKKFFAILMTLALMLSLAVPAMAADTNGTVTNGTDRDYKAYQIFKGTQAANDEVLGDVEWGTGIDYGAFLTDLKSSDDFVVESSNIFTNCNTAADVASALKGITDKSEIAQSFANLAEKHLTDTATGVAANETVTLASGYYLLVDQTTVDGENKAKNPALLQVTNDDDLNITVKYDTPKVDKTIKDEGEAAEGSIGDTFTFVLTATMPSTFEGYDSYKVIFHDTLSKGLTYNKDATVSVEGFEVKTSAGDNDSTIITITNNNILEKNVAAGSTITVTYTATLNADAVVGAAGNPNIVKLEYSNDPDWDGTPGSGDEPTGETPEDKVVVFTFELDVTKTDGETDEALADAKFKLENAAGKWATVDANGKLTGWADDKDGGSVLTSDANGLFKVIGLDQGTYKLHEIEAPAGYNLLKAPITIVITAAVTGTEDAQELTGLTIQVGDQTENDMLADGIVGTTVENNAGATLPETGGIGTTIFYIVGGLMVVAAVVLLVTKKRMSAEG